MPIKIIARISEVNRLDWNKLAAKSYPFIRHEFLSALEETGCVGGQTGWKPQHIVVVENNRLIAFMPLYQKSHSSGEYVFDHAWAHFYHQHGEAYYPKWLTAIPFTPCQGSRLVCHADVNLTDINREVFSFITSSAQSAGISSWHGLFFLPEQIEGLKKQGLAIREGVQFQWFNRGYRDFDDFLDAFSASKRKMIKRERRKVAEAGIAFIQIKGNEASEQDWQVFYRFYVLTYLKKNSRPYLNLAFFMACAQSMGEQMRLVLAIKDKQYVGGALSFLDNDTLYGRYWGCYEEFNFLHFEACYYQGLDYCIEQRLQRFDSGAQGEHKIARGFEPILTYSAHWIKYAPFRPAIADFLVREQAELRAYKAAVAETLPYKANKK